MAPKNKRFANSRKAVTCLSRLHRTLCGQLRGAVDARAITRAQFAMSVDRAQRDYSYVLRHLASVYGALRNLRDLTERQQADHIEAAMKLLDLLGVATEFPQA